MLDIEDPKEKLTPLGLTQSEAESRYKREVEEAGDLVNREPRIHLKGIRRSSPYQVERQSIQR